MQEQSGRTELQTILQPQHVVLRGRGGHAGSAVRCRACVGDAVDAGGVPVCPFEVVLLKVAEHADHVEEL